jgi:hypothetical protein
MEPKKNKLLLILQELMSKGVRVRVPREQYDNWGGLITKKDMAGLDIAIEENSVKKIGACSLIFFRVGVLATGKVNACSCRDVNATLGIGDITEQPLIDILSLEKNRIYRQIVKQQSEGNFQNICKACNFYMSIYDLRTASMNDVFKSKNKFDLCQSKV